jgi:hypothetical protein
MGLATLFSGAVVPIIAMGTACIKTGRIAMYLYY